MKKKAMSLLLAAAMVMSTGVGVMGYSTDVKAADDVPTLRVFLNVNNAQDGFQDDATIKSIEEKLGIKLSLEAYDADKESAMTASGDLADIVCLNNPDYITPLIKSEALLDLTPYLEQAPNLAANETLLQFSRDELSDGTGNLYVLPARAKKDGTPVYPSQSGSFIRWDYFKEIGAPELNTIDDLVNAVAKIVENHPTTEDGKKVYGFTSWTDWGNYAMYGSTSPLMKWFGQYELGCGMGYFDTTTQEFVDYYDDESLIWKCAELLYKANQAGILDPEAFIQKFNDASSKFANNQIVLAPAEWIVHESNTKLPETATYEDIPFADTEEYPALYTRSVPFGFAVRSCVISADTEYPEKAVEFLDYCFSEEGARTILNGPEGVAWEKDGDSYKYLDSWKETMATDPNYINAYGVRKLEGIVGFDYDAKDANGNYYDLGLEPETLAASFTAADKEYMEHYGAESVIDVVGNRTNKSEMNMGIVSLMDSNVPTSINRTATQIDQYLGQAYQELVYSADDAAFTAKVEEMKAELKKLGYDDVAEFYRNSINNAKEKIAKYE